MNKLFKNIRADKILNRSFQASSILIVITGVYIGVLYQHLPPFIPVFNQLPWGIERLGEKYMIFLPIALSLGMFIANSVVANVFYERMPLVMRMIGITTFFISIISFIFIIRTTLLVL